MKRLLLSALFWLNISFGLYAQEKDQYLILISLDGYRHDYTSRFQPPNLARFARDGASARSLIPSFPSKTFPNHYTIATGLKPGNNGLVDNTFYDPDKDYTYRIGDTTVVRDGTWYGGKPIWVWAEENDLISASYFFVGSEANIQGKFPTYYYPYDGNTPNRERVNQALEWLSLPENERPRLITMYFSDMDDIGHRYGPDNDEKLKAALFDLDSDLGVLFDGIEAMELDVNVLIVSDHGMTNVTLDRLIDIAAIIEPYDLEYRNNGALAHLYLKDPHQKHKIRKAINRENGHYQAVNPKKKKYYGKMAFPKRVGDLLIIPDMGYYLVAPSSFVRYQRTMAKMNTAVIGEHGYHPSEQDMHAIFYAKGPAIKDGMEFTSFENIHIYPLMCAILGLPIPEGIDGKEKVLKKILVK